MKLIDDWKKAWKFLSVQVSSVFAAAVSAWLVLPEDQRHQLISLLPFDMGGKGPAIMVLAGFVGVIFARIKSQPGLDVNRGGAPPPGDDDYPGHVPPRPIPAPTPPPSVEPDSGWPR